MPAAFAGPHSKSVKSRETNKRTGVRVHGQLPAPGSTGLLRAARPGARSFISAACPRWVAPGIERQLRQQGHIAPWARASARQSASQAAALSPTNRSRTRATVSRSCTVAVVEHERRQSSDARIRVEQVRRIYTDPTTWASYGDAHPQVDPQRLVPVGMPHGGYQPPSWSVAGGPSGSVTGARRFGDGPIGGVAICASSMRGFGSLVSLGWASTALWSGLARCAVRALR